MNGTSSQNETENAEINLRLVSHLAPCLFVEFLATWKNEIQLSDKKDVRYYYHSSSCIEHFTQRRVQMFYNITLFNEKYQID
jgi:hypothetical protein